jgi:hypothetical protein
LRRAGCRCRRGRNSPLGGVSSVLIGLLPTYAHIGASAQFLLVALRIIQGFALSLGSRSSKAVSSRSPSRRPSRLMSGIPARPSLTACRVAGQRRERLALGRCRPLRWMEHSLACNDPHRAGDARRRHESYWWPVACEGTQELVRSSWGEMRIFCPGICRVK